MDSFYYFAISRTIIMTFFQNGIWVLGFFYLLFKIFEIAKLKHYSKYVIVIILAILLINAVQASI